MRLKWTDALIEESLRGITAQVGRFPTAALLREMGRDDLYCAISRKGGLVEWAARLGLARAHSDSDTGWEGESTVQKLLEQYGFAIERSRSLVCPYDLKINGVVRCDVKTTKLAKYTNCPAWYFRIGKAVQADIVILYRGDTNDCFVLPWFHVGKSNITISPSSPKYEPFKNRFDIIKQYTESIEIIRQTVPLLIDTH